MPPNDVFNNFWNAAFDIIVSSPLMLLTIALAWVSGHLWAYILLSWFSKKERKRLVAKLIDSRFGRIVLGLCWFSIIIIPVHLVFYRSLSFTFYSVISVLPNVLVFGLAIHTLIFAYVNFLFKKRGALDE